MRQVYANLHLAEATYAHPVPMKVFILAMLLEQHKVAVRLRRVVGELKTIPIISQKL